MEKGEPSGLDYNGGLHAACKGGHIYTAKLMMEKGEPSGLDYNGGLREACKSGHLDVVKLMIEKGADDYTWALRGACKCHQYYVILFMLQRGATDPHSTYLTQETNQLQLLSDGISRTQLKNAVGFTYTEETFRKLDEIKEFVTASILIVLPVKDLISICTDYACL